MNFEVGDHVQWRDSNFLGNEDNRYNGTLVEKVEDDRWIIKWDDGFDDTYNGTFPGNSWPEEELSLIV